MIISSITLDELENIKSSRTKDEEIKFSARQVLSQLDKYYGVYNIITYNDDMLKACKLFSETNDLKIISCALHWEKEHPSDTLFFITNDMSCKHLARLFFNNVTSVQEDLFDYDGYKEVYMSQEDMNNIYTNLNKNIYNLNINEYIIIYDKETKEIVDKLCWTGNGHRNLSYKTFDSNAFGKVKPIPGDVYQALFADSLTNNQITQVKGPAGSGKTFLSLAYLMNQLERNKIDKIIIFCNTVATKNSARLGLIVG